ncbi:MAG: AAA family ATPase [bacterium]
MGDSDAELARRIAFEGTKALTPVEGRRAWRLGDAWTFSESEDRALRTVEGLIRAYVRVATPPRPLCLAVFGAPGSGKSFAVKQLAKTLGGDAIGLPLTELNLTQIAGPAALARQLAQAADEAVRTATTGKAVVPFVFFDEFDAPLDGAPLGWLSWFLAPMQDGEFTADLRTVKLRRAIYIFGGGTAERLRDFEMAHGARFRTAKGPDFVSRLRGSLDVKGPNEPERREVRRAFGLRNALDKVGESHGLGRGRLVCDDQLYTAMLHVGRFRHGQRSIEAIVEMAAGARSQPLTSHPPTLTRDDLPADEVLAIHSDRGPLDPGVVGGLIGLSSGGAPSGTLATRRDAMWEALAEMLWASGAALAYGGNWDADGQTYKLLRRLDGLPVPLRKGPLLDAGVRVEVFALERPATPVNDERVRVVAVPPVRAPEPLRAAARLFRMRWQSAARCVARVALSGKMEGYSGRMPGILEEVMIALVLRQPLYIIGGLGGGANYIGRLLGLATDWSVPPELKPGLPIAAGHEHLFRTPSHPNLPLGTNEAITYVAAHAIGGPGWPANGLTVEENRELYGLGGDEDDERAAALVRRGLERYFGRPA